MINNSLAIITSQVGKTDLPWNINELRIHYPFINFIAFTDSLNKQDFIRSGWITKEIIQTTKIKQSNNRLKSRVCKINPAKLDMDEEYCLWIDSNVRLKKEFIDTVLEIVQTQTFDLYTFIHPKKSKIIEEIIHCYCFGKLSIKQLIKAIYINRSILNTSGAVRWGGCLLWNRKSKNSLNLQFLWSNLVFNHCPRDQISLPVAIKKSSALCKDFDQSCRIYINVISHFNYSKHDIDIVSRIFSYYFNLLFRWIKQIK